jgi:integrase
MLIEDERPVSFFEADQFRAVLESLPEYLQPVIQTAYIAGWRIRSEILTRLRHHVNLKSGNLLLEPEETVGGEGRSFPLTPELRGILLRQLERTKELERETGRLIPWLFHHHGKPIKDFRKAWAVACERGDVAGKTPSDFRQTAVRNLERAGVPCQAAMAMVGHRSDSIYRRYPLADETMLKESATKLAALHEWDRID